MIKSITELLGITYPIIQGGMAWISDAGMAASVSNAGGAGVISTGGRTTEYTRDEIRRAKTLTDKPFGVNVMLMAPNKNEIVDVICEEKPAFVTLGAGNPVPFFEQLHAAGIKVIPVVPNAKLAKRVESNGADAVVIEGMEAGGHIGVLTTMALATQVIPEVSLPVILAGGIADGRGLAAALVMGAAFFLYGRYTQTHYKTTFYRETSEKVSRNIRLAVVSDLHNREYGENNEALISDLQALHPDLILFPGDMVIREDDDYRQMLDTVSALAGIAPCYGVLGNHESERIYFRGDRALPDRFENAGLPFAHITFPDVGVITNISPNHLDWHTDMEEYACSKCSTEHACQSFSSKKESYYERNYDCHKSRNYHFFKCSTC